jgi:basic membrane protein A
VRPEATTALLVALAVGLVFVPPRKKNATVTPVTHRAGAARIGLVFDVGGRGDKSFNDKAFDGLERAQKELDVETAYLEPVGSEDREAALRLFASRHFDLVIGVGFIFSSDVDTVARAYPNVSFACVDYFPPPDGPPPNVAGLVFREEEGSFLVGAAAGLLSRTHHVGFVGGMTSPLIRRFEAGYEAGVKAACPACFVHSGYAGASPEAFRDPAKGKAIAISQIAAGADVLYHASGSTGLGVFQGAHDAHAMAIGVDADQYDEMPDTVVTSMVKRVDVAVFEVIKEAREHRFEGGMHAFGLREDGVDYIKSGAHAARLPASVREQVDTFRGEVIAGRIQVPSR